MTTLPRTDTSTANTFTPSVSDSSRLPLPSSGPFPNSAPTAAIIGGAVGGAIALTLLFLTVLPLRERRLRNLSHDELSPHVLGLPESPERPIRASQLHGAPQYERPE
jgi:hypothetical protein